MSRESALCLPDATAAEVDAIARIHEATAIYTASPVVRELLDWIDWPCAPGNLLDPSCGDGSFLIEALQRLSPAPNDWGAVGRIRGYEFHAGAVFEAQGRLAAKLCDLGWTSESARIAARRIVHQRDFLAQGCSEVWTHIVGNPPYLRFSRVPDFFKDRYRPLVESYALGDLLDAFLDRCSKQLAPGGSLLAVVSDRWLSNDSTAGLRAALGDRLVIEHLSRLDTSSSFYRASTRRKQCLPRVHAVSVVFRAREGREKNLTSAAIYPGSAPDAQAEGQTLADIAELRMAPWLGPEGVFIQSLESAASYPQGDWVPVVDMEDIDSATDELREPTRLGLRSRRDREPSGDLAAFLREARHLLPARARSKSYWMPPESLGDDAVAERILIPRIAQRIRCVPLPVGIQGMNHNIVVAAKGPATLAQIREVLLAPESHEWLSQKAQRLEGGYFFLKTRQLRQLPVPARLASAFNQDPREI